MISEYIIMLCPCEMFIICTSFLVIWQCPDIQVMAIYAFPKIHLNVKIIDYKVKTKIFWRLFSRIHYKTYADWIMHHQIGNELSNNSKNLTFYLSDCKNSCLNKHV